MSQASRIRSAHLSASRFLCAGAILTLAVVISAKALAQDGKGKADAEKTFKPRVLDLMGIIDPDLDSVKGKGKWKKTSKDELVCEDQHFVPRVQVRYEPPEEYDFIIKFSQAKLRHAVSLMLPNPNGGHFLWKVGVRDGNDFELMSKSATIGKAPGLIKANTEHTTIVQVRRNSVRCFVDGKELVSTTTDFKDLMIDSWHKMPQPTILGVGCDDPTVFTAVWIKEISGPGKVRPRDKDTSKKK